MPATSTTTVDIEALANDIEGWAQTLGFQAIAITDPDLGAWTDRFRTALAERLFGDMGYLERNVDKRLAPERLHPGTVRIITARMNYLGVEPPAQTELPVNDGTAAIARYALGRDYHKVVRRRLARLAAMIEAGAEARSGARVPRSRAFADSAPVLEKPIAVKAGLGWQGKNTLVLNRNAGSWFFLGEIFTNLPLPISEPAEQPGCGSCKACQTVCPTAAFIAPYKLDARRCIAYLTIEHKGAIPAALRPAIGSRVFGCDDCQIVCPWNRFAQRSAEADFAPRHGLDNAAIADLLRWDEAEFLVRTAGMALRRINFSQWVRNLAVAAGNAPPDLRIIAGLGLRRMDATEMVREHIDWALARQRGTGTTAQVRKSAPDNA